MGCDAISGSGHNNQAVFPRSGFLIEPLSILTPSKWKKTSAMSPSTQQHSTTDNKVDGI